MLAKRIIPCLDIKDGQTVKGIQFENLRPAGDPIELAAYYAAEGADELVFLDITATHERREPLAALVRRVAEVINIPFTVGGGIATVEQVEALLQAGADKVSVNSAAVRRPELINALAQAFGSQCVVLSADVKRDAGGGWRVFLNGGRIPTEINAMEWIRESVDRGVGEILLTSMEHDGVKNGFALELTSMVSSSIGVPVIASGGGGGMDHFQQIFSIGQADAALAASVFHYGEIRIPALKNYLQTHEIIVRI